NDANFYLVKVTDTPPAGSPHYAAEKYQVYLGWLADPKGNLAYNGYGDGVVPVGAYKSEMGLLGLSLHKYSYRVGGPVIDAELNYISGNIDGVGAADPDISGISMLVATTFGPWGLTFVYGTGQDPAETPATGGKLNVNALSANYTLGNILLNTDKDSDREGGSLDVKRLGISAVKGAYTLVKNEKNSADVALIFAQTAEDASATVSSNTLGVEIDANATCKLDKNLEFSAGIGYLIAGTAWETLHGGNDDNPLKLHLAATFTF
ncbi:MAG: hypothetical protein AAB300_02295, partial [Nitrospirota bacterium]